MILNAVLSFLLLIFQNSTASEIVNKCKKLHIEILISPLGNRLLEVQWENAPKLKGDWIGLFYSDPLDPKNKGVLPTILDRVEVTQTHGWAHFTTTESHLPPEDLGFQAQCIGYYIAYFNENNEGQISSCLRMEPTWMWDLKKEIGPKKIKDVFIPGTHDSAAYDEYSALSQTLLTKYSITQDERILGQLIYGARYLDLRVGRYNLLASTWWANHGILRIHPIKDVLRDVKIFLNKTNEIVILDFHEFPVGFSTLQDHLNFISFLNEELWEYFGGGLINWDFTFDQFWAAKHRLIVGYNRKAILPYANFLLPGVHHKWGDVQSLHSLYAYMMTATHSRSKEVWSAMAQLTPTAADAVLDRTLGLRYMAESINHNVTEWFRRDDWRLKTNIVSVDFLRNTGIVRSAIEWNKNQGGC